MAVVAVLYDYTDGPEDAARRDAVRPAHREFLHSQPNLLLTGPTAAGGAIIVFAGEPAEVEALMDRDPFHLEGLVATRTVTTWDVVGGSRKDALGV